MNVPQDERVKTNDTAQPTDARSALAYSDEERRFTFWQRAQIWLISFLATWAIRLIGPTLRYTLSYEEGALQPWDSQQAIWAFWHRCVFPAAWKFRNNQIAVMTSRSYDGEYIARTIERLGFSAVRGSSSRGGAVALRGMQRVLESGRSVAFTIDGPRGPKYVAKIGPVILARNTQLPIMCFYAALERPWVLNSWDRFMIPKPFSRVFLRASKAIRVPADAEPDVVTRHHQEMQAALERATTYAEAEISKL